MLDAGAALGVAEQAMRAALASSGAALLQAVLDEQDDGYAGPHSGCGCGGQAVYSGSRPKTITTVLGAVTLQRAWYHCAACRAGFAPRDRQLGLLADGALSPGLAEMAALAGAEVSFARAAALLVGLAGVTVSARTIERSAESAGAAARAAAGAEAAAITARVIVPLPRRRRSRTCSTSRFMPRRWLCRTGWCWRGFALVGGPAACWAVRHNHKLSRKARRLSGGR